MGVFFAARVRVRARKQTFSSDCKQMAGCQVEPLVLVLLYIAAGSELKAAHQCVKSRSQINGRAGGERLKDQWHLSEVK